MKHYVLVCGSRNYNDSSAVEEVLNFLHGFYAEDLRVLHGAAKGADMLAEWACKRLGITFRAFPADWDGLGKAAGVKRNLEMITYLDFCRDKGHTTQILAFPGGIGTNHCVSEAERRDHPVDRISWET